MHHLFNIGILLSLISCGVLRTHSARTKFNLTNVGGLIISNTSTNPYEIERGEGIARLRYSIIIKNTNPESVTINLEDSRILIDKDESVFECTNLDKMKKFQLSSNEYSKIICSKDIIADQKNKLTTRDTLARLKIQLTNDLISEYSFKLITSDFK